MRKYQRSFFLCPPPRPQVGVPRRFDIGTTAILATVFVVLFSVLIILNVPLGPSVGITIFVAGVTACQAILFKGKDPRAASMVGGSIIFYLLMVVVSLTNDFGPRDFTKETTFSISGFFLLLVIGGLLGYVGGGLVAAVFLIRKKPGKTTLVRANGNLSQTTDK